MLLEMFNRLQLEIVFCERYKGKLDCYREITRTVVYSSLFQSTKYRYKYVKCPTYDFVPQCKRKHINCSNLECCYYIHRRGAERAVRVRPETNQHLVLTLNILCCEFT